MKIMFFTGSVARQGTFFRWHNWAIGLKALGHQVTVQSFDSRTLTLSLRTEEIDGITYSIAGGIGGQRYFSPENHPIAAIRGCFRGSETCDVTHVFGPYLTSALPWLVRGHSLAPVIVYDWDDLWRAGLASGKAQGLAGHWSTGWTKWLEGSLPRRADHVTTCSGYLADLAIADGAKGTTVIPNGFWPASYPNKSDARQELGLRPDCVYAGFMGRTITNQEIGWLAAAVRIAAQDSARWRVAICGMPESLFAEHFHGCRQAIDYLGFLTPEKSKVFASALDIGLLPLEDAPMNRARYPIKFTEYLAAGVPVLMTKVGPCAAISSSWPEVIQAEPTQLSWQGKFAELMVQIGMNGQIAVDGARMISECSWINMARKLEETYRRLFGSKLPQGDEI
jgi:glycosyltransferase involved in cell wall biosynthesis